MDIDGYDDVQEENLETNEDDLDNDRLDDINNNENIDEIYSVVKKGTKVVIK